MSDDEYEASDYDVSENDEEENEENEEENDEDEENEEEGEENDEEDEENEEEEESNNEEEEESDDETTIVKKDKKVINKGDFDYANTILKTVNTRLVMGLYELTHILASRSTQLQNGAKPMITNIYGLTTEEIAIQEIKLKKCPMYIYRIIPNKGQEKISVNSFKEIIWTK